MGDSSVSIGGMQCSNIKVDTESGNTVVKNSVTGELEVYSQSGDINLPTPLLANAKLITAGKGVSILTRLLFI